MATAREISIARPAGIHVAGIVGRGAVILETDGQDITNRQLPPALDSARELVTQFDDNVARLTAALAKADYAVLAQSWAMRRGSQVLIERPRRELLRVMM